MTISMLWRMSENILSIDAMHGSGTNRKRLERESVVWFMLTGSVVVGTRFGWVPLSSTG
jgi:hypothetical protein